MQFIIFFSDIHCTYTCMCCVCIYIYIYIYIYTQHCTCKDNSGDTLKIIMEIIPWEVWLESCGFMKEIFIFHHMLL